MLVPADRDTRNELPPSRVARMSGRIGLHAPIAAFHDADVRDAVERSTAR